MNIKHKPDELLMLYVKDKCITEAEARNVLMLPLVELPELGNGVDNEWTRFLDSEGANVVDKDVMVTREDFFLLEASYWIPGIGFYVFKIKPTIAGMEEYSPICLEFEFFYFVHKPDARKIVLRGEVTIDSTGLSEQINFQNFNILHKGKKQNISESKNSELAIKQIIYGIRTIYFFGMFQQSLDLYPVVVTRKDPKKLTVGKDKVNRRLENLSINSPRIVFLNALPEQYSKTDVVPGGESLPRKLHQRKGYWKTLKDERFSKHPKYLIENAIRVKPAWVGSVKSEYNGNVYKVILPSNKQQSE